MHLLTALLACLLSLFGGDGPGSRTRIDFARAGQGVLLSKTTLADGLATFQCLSSGSGACHYRLYQEICKAAVGGTALEQHCCRRELGRFQLHVGARRQVGGLPADFAQCVVAAQDAPGCA